MSTGAGAGSGSEVAGTTGVGVLDAGADALTTEAATNVGAGAAVGAGALPGVAGYRDIPFCGTLLFDES